MSIVATRLQGVREEHDGRADERNDAGVKARLEMIRCSSRAVSRR